MGGRLWSDYEIKRALELSEKGVPQKQIATELGRTADQVKYKIRDVKRETDASEVGQ